MSVVITREYVLEIICVSKSLGIFYILSNFKSTLSPINDRLTVEALEETLPTHQLKHRKSHSIDSAPRFGGGMC